jgi:cytochrome oxidase Cu insertion factor (SCO1/SenC/PrrC family)
MTACAGSLLLAREVLAQSPVQDHAHHHAHGAPASAAATAPASPAPAEAAMAGASAPRDAASWFTNLELLDQDGQRVRFYSDVLAGRTVLINVIYTSCKDACPLLTQQLVQVRQALPTGLFGQRVHFVSISSDPDTDDPAALRRFAREQGASDPGWTFLTGRKAHVEQILKRLGQYSETVEGHSTLFIAGNVAARRWSKIRPDTTPALIAQKLVSLADAGPVQRP